ncbi:winged helix DNA-binding domain-containing protein [Kineosporia sp. NBRC 101731]|uniref:winged helix DNA-binding domain-containing protein n=1 Tax=Kineosporia sp. NBRC 101731 TaxID=3032199 RepID=UPI0024A08E4D|nr:winged helix DNA-binding domain-containing protein [Kineosporia sp. NBRC 101731]GLY33569.1 hypothetical protein Kisp02_69340 [Kineosporia sp. NBRC 101731]
MRITADQALAWRLERQFLSPRENVSRADIVRRLGGVQSQVASAAETSIATRQQTPGAASPENDALIRTWAMRGTLHLCHSSQLADVLSLLAASRTWTKPSWQKTFGATPDEIDQLAEAVRELLGDGNPMTRDELVTCLVAESRFADLETELRSGWGALLKPLAWQGALCHGPARGSRITFTTPSALIPGWSGLPSPDDAAPSVITTYLGAFGPAPATTFDNWLIRGVTRKSMLRSWFTGMGDRLTEVSVDGQSAFVLSEHADELAATKPSRAVHLLGPFDAYVLGATTKDTWMLPAEHRDRISRAAGWIAPVILSGGRVVGTWELEHGDVVTEFFPGEKVLSRRALAAEVDRVTGH